MTLRIITALILLFSVLFLPFYVSVVVALAGIVYFSYFIEAVVLFFLMDLLYGVREVKFSQEVYVLLITSLVFVFVAEIVKKKLKFYPNQN